MLNKQPRYTVHTDSVRFVAYPHEPPDDWAKYAIRRSIGWRLIGARVAVAAGIAALILFSVLYAQERRANDALSRDPVTVTGTVVKEHFSRFFMPAKVIVEYRLDGTRYEAAVSQRVWESITVGQDLTVLVESGGGGRARLPDRRYVDPTVWYIGLGGAVALVMGLLIGAMWHRSADSVDTGRWSRHPARVVRSMRTLYLDLPGERHVDGAIEPGWLRYGAIEGRVRPGIHDVFVNTSPAGLIVVTGRRNRVFRAAPDDSSGILFEAADLDQFG
ncbi:MAG: hypothetical protein HKN91_08880 [Acidimicrobiia bacterium]|nr:hypothetical protein [Acidimicrobiia bacterium]